jgi:predicted esterase
MKPNIESRQIGEWVVMQQAPPGNGPHPVLLLLHGWTGDESVMWVFTRRLSDRYLMIAPRGIFQTSSGGFGWQPNINQKWPEVADFRIASDALIELLNSRNFPTGKFSEISGIGFSQGAALMFTFALLHPKGLRRWQVWLDFYQKMQFF